MKNLNKKGFTLVELLAVIVVLALIMVLTVPSVLTSMNSARQSSFLLYAGKMIESAQGKYQSQLLIGVRATGYSLESLSDNASTQYSGTVQVTYDENNTPIFKIQMYDKSYQIGFKADPTGDNVKPLGDKAGGVTYAEIENIKRNLAEASLKPAPTSAELEEDAKKTTDRVFKTTC